jgi:outer membrane usher protein
VGYDLNYSRQEQVDEILGALTYVGNRAEVRLEQSIASTIDGNFGDESRTSLLFASSIVYADRRLALARPVYDSFAMFEPNASASEFVIAADPQGGFGSVDRRYSAKSSRLGPAVVPDLASYLVRSVQVDAPDAPAGVSVGGDVFVLKPAFRSGYRLVVGDAGNVSLMGRLVDENGAAIPLAAGYAVMSRKDGEVRVPVFTNAGGRFFVEGVAPGEVVSLRFESPSELRADIKAPDDVIGIVRYTLPVVAAQPGSSAPAVQEPAYSVEGEASE